MIFPTLALWSRNEDDLARLTADQIDRSLEDRQHRMTIGLSISHSFQQVEGCLLVTQGRGKFIRFAHAVGATQDLSSVHRELGLAFRNQEKSDVRDLELLTRDLADVQSAVVSQLKVAAGKYVDRILASAVLDPGLWFQDFDGATIYRGLCHANCLAESTGISVIDEFPARDLAVGGTGDPLEALPVWMMLADRSRTIASETRCLLVQQEEQVREFWLPASDGLDAEFPQIRFRQVRRDQWAPTDTSASTTNQKGTASRGTSSRHRWILAGDTSFVAMIRKRIADTRGETTAATVNPLDTDCSREDEISLWSDVLGADVSVGALSAAVLGLFQIDQLPANLVELTGADSQRILGRLTPGRPSNWRQLIRSMAQYRPAPMKLKDAI